MLENEPFIRWAGGKNWLIKYLPPLIDKLKYKNYYEPFLGGAAVFFAFSHPKHCYLSDINQDLVDTYIAVRDMPEEVYRYFLLFQNNEEDYYRVRNLLPEDSAEKAARFIFLNQTSFNGIYRVNKQGEYNVPYGKRTNLNYSKDRIIMTSKKLQKVKVRCCDFEGYKYRIKEGDLVFLDPPYTVSHNNNGFIEYNQVLFSLEDQYRLSRFIDFIKSKGAFYILTNTAHPIIKEIFEKDGDRILSLSRHSSIGGKQAKRESVLEYVFTNIPEEVIADVENNLV